MFRDYIADVDPFNNSDRKVQSRHETVTKLDSNQIIKKSGIHSDLPVISIVRSKNTYVDIPLSQEDYYYDDDYYDLGYGPPYFHQEENRDSYVYHQLPQQSTHMKGPHDQFIFPDRYVISQPHSASTPYDRRLIIKLPANTPPDTPLLGAMGVQLPAARTSPDNVFQRLIESSRSEPFQTSLKEDRDLTWTGSDAWIHKTLKY